MALQQALKLIGDSAAIAPLGQFTAQQQIGDSQEGSQAPQVPVLPPLLPGCHYPRGHLCQRRCQSHFDLQLHESGALRMKQRQQCQSRPQAGHRGMSMQCTSAVGLSVPLL